MITDFIRRIIDNITLMLLSIKYKDETTDEMEWDMSREFADMSSKYFDALHGTSNTSIVLDIAGTTTEIDSNRILYKGNEASIKTYGATSIGIYCPVQKDTVFTVRLDDPAIDWSPRRPTGVGDLPKAIIVTDVGITGETN